MTEINNAQPTNRHNRYGFTVAERWDVGAPAKFAWAGRFVEL